MKKNKDFLERNIDVFFMILIIILLISSYITITYIENLNKDIACKDLGYNEYQYITGISTCSDLNDNLYYVKLSNCNWLKKCDIKEITMGGNRIKQ